MSIFDEEEDEAPIYTEEKSEPTTKSTNHTGGKAQRSFLLDRDLLDLISTKAEQDGRSVNQFMNRFLRKVL